MSRRRLRGLLGLCAAGILGLTGGLAELPWPDSPTEGQAALAAYVERVNVNLAALNERPINSVFECWPRIASVGITAEDNADAPDQEGDVAITVTLTEQDVAQLTVEMSDLDRFPAVCAALIQASAPGSVTLEEAMAFPNGCVERIRRNTERQGDAIIYRSFADEVSAMRGDAPQVFFSYDYNVYGQEGVGLVSMTLVFPRAGAEAPVQLTPPPDDSEPTAPPPTEDDDGLWVGYFPELGDEEHFEIFVTPTPEPDSAVYN